MYALIAHLIINLFIQPFAFSQMRGEILKVRTDIASQMVRAGEFVTPTVGLTVYAREIAPDGAMKDVIIYDTRDDNGATTHTAKTGRIARNGESASLVLQNGNVQQILDDGSLDLIAFDDYQIDLSDMMTRDQVLRRKPSDLYLHELLRPNQRTYAGHKYRQELKAEGHNRLATPIYNLALIMLALCFMIRGEHQRMGYGRKIALCAAIGFVIRLTGFGLASAAETDPALNPVQYVLPLLVCILCALYLLRRKRMRSAKHFLKRRAKRNEYAPT